MLIATAREVDGAKRNCRCLGGLFLKTLKPLFVSSNNDSGHVRCIDDGVVELGTSQLRKINEFVRNLFHFSADLLTGFQTQLDSLSGVSLQNVKNGIAGL